MTLVTPNQMKHLEATADSNGTSYERLMLNAGLELSNVIEGYMYTHNEVDRFNIVFLCGNGNNAGDCFVASSRYLLNSNHVESITIAMLCGTPKTELSKMMFAELPQCEGLKVTFDLNTIKQAISKSDIVCDGIFGTGFHGELPKDIQEVLATPSSAYRIAVDVPSGVDCKTGSVSSGTLKADETVTFAYNKLGMALYPASEYCGKVTTVDIGITEAHYETLGERVSLLDSSCIRLPHRSDLGNKGTFGRVLHVTGSKDMVGACIMASKSALRCGVGLVTICTEDHSILPITMPEPIYIDRSFESISKALERSTAVLVGCGLGTSEKSVELLKYVVQSAECPLVIDADGINILSNCIDIIDNQRVVLTPHPLEMSRLANIPVGEVQSNRLEVATSFAKEHGCIVVLKGANTIVTDGYDSFVDTVANSGMSKGGSGDVLAGMVSSFLAQGMGLLDACKLSVYVHSQSGLYCANRLTKYSMLPTDVIDEIPNVIKSLI